MMPEESQNHRRWDKSSYPTVKVLQNVSCIHTAFIDTSMHQHILETTFWIVLYPNSVPGNTEVEEVDPSHAHTKRSCCMHLGTLHPQLTVALSPYACWFHSPVDSFACLKAELFSEESLWFLLSQHWYSGARRTVKEYDVLDYHASNITSLKEDRLVTSE